MHPHGSQARRQSGLVSTLLAPASLVLATAACGDDGKRPLGASCTESTECESGLCRQSVCVDPRLVEDPGPVDAGPRPVIAYVTRDNVGSNISLVTVAADGGLVEHAASPFGTDVGNATEVAFTPDGAHAYVGSGSNGDVPVHALDLDPDDHTPTTNPSPPLENDSGLKRWDTVVIHPGGAFVFAADAESDGDRVYAYAVDGGAAGGSLRQLDTSVDVSNVSQLDMDPLGRFLLAANESADYGFFDLAPDGRVDGTLGEATPGESPDFIRSMRFGARGDVVYLLTAAALHAYDFDRETRALTEIAGSPFEAMDTRVLEVDPQGRFLFAAGAAGVFLHRINPSGTVALVDIDDDALNGVTGHGRGFGDLAFGGGGAFLFATGEATTSFRVGDDGLLELLTTIAVSGSRIAVLSL